MRDYLDGILSFIGAESLSDQEFGTITVEDQGDDLACFEALLGVLESREDVSNTTTRLQYYFLAKGVTTEDISDENVPPQSNIFVGGSLE